MKLRRVRLIGCGHRRINYANHEGYSDPTAGCALSGSRDIYAAPVIREPGEKERVVRRRLPSISEMDDYLARIAGKDGERKIRYVFQEGKWRTKVITAREAEADL